MMAASEASTGAASNRLPSARTVAMTAFQEREDTPRRRECHDSHGARVASGISRINYPCRYRQLTRGFGVWSMRAGLSRKKGLAGISD